MELCNKMQYMKNDLIKRLESFRLENKITLQKLAKLLDDNLRAQLENEVARLNKKIAKYEAIELKQNRFGLVWLDVPEAFEDDAENKLPILEEIPKLAIYSKDGKPTHLLIEGDNYHALTCLRSEEHTSEL